MKKRITASVKSFFHLMLLFPLVITFPENVNAAFFGVDSWEDCILENLDEYTGANLRIQVCSRNLSFKNFSQLSLVMAYGLKGFLSESS